MNIIFNIGNIFFFTILVPLRDTYNLQAAILCQRYRLSGALRQPDLWIWPCYRAFKELATTWIFKSNKTDGRQIFFQKTGVLISDSDFSQKKYLPP